MSKAAVDNNTSSIPVVDLSLDDETEVATNLVRALTTTGFALLTHHGIDHEAVVAPAFAASKAFFDQPLAVKEQYPYQGHASNRGYIAPGRERHEFGKNPDDKETFDIGRNDEAGYTNPWPQEVEATCSFEATMLQYWSEFHALHLKLLKWIAMGLKLEDPEFFVKRCQEQHCNLRLLHYPAITVVANEQRQKTNEKDDDSVIVRGALHTDFGTLTLLSQDNVGGLRVLPRTDSGDAAKEWIRVPVVAGSIVLNVGDMLQRWSNDVLVATPHQVIGVIRGINNDDDPEHESTVTIPERYSIAFFCNADKSSMLEGMDGVSKYPPISAMDYLTQRLTDTINVTDDK